MALTLQLNIDGKENVVRMMDKITLLSSVDMEQFFYVIKDWFFDSQKKIFKTEGQYLNGQWKALSPDYAEWKQENYPNQPILQMTGALYNAMTSDGGNTTTTIGRKDMKIEVSDIVYLRTHDRGRKQGKGEIPQRQFLGTNPVMLVDLDKRMQKKLNELLKEQLT